MSAKENRPAGVNGRAVTNINNTNDYTTSGTAVPTQAAATTGDNGTVSDLYTFGLQCRRWGAAVTAIKPGTKWPYHKWKPWQTQPQTDLEFESLPWRSAAAIGVVNGAGDWRMFDLDAIKDDEGRPVTPVPEEVVVELLKSLGLPDDYQWSYVSGSGAGFGVVIRCAESLPASWNSKKGVHIGSPREGLAFGQLELRWSSGQTVIDGAHPTGPGYRWRRGERPFVAPALLTAEHVIAGFTAVAAMDVPSAQTSAAAAPSRTGKGTGYGAAALADAVDKVSRAANGTRNNTLFREAAGLAELVNGGALDRGEVEQQLTAAALAADLTADEVSKTVASAFAHVGGKGRSPKSTLKDIQPASGPINPQKNDDATFKLRMDDVGNAERFVLMHGDNVRFNHSRGHWLIWKGTHWQQDDDGAIYRLAKETARAIYEEAKEAANNGNDDLAASLSKWARSSATESRLKAMLNLASSEFPIAITQERLNCHDLLLNVQNGTFDLATCELRPHDRADLLTYALAVVYDSAALCPTWDRFLARILNQDDEMKRYVASAVGYTLSGSTAEQVLFFLYGSGANGKSTFIETIMSLLGYLGLKTRAQILMQTDRDRVPNEVAALAGKRMIVASELIDGGRLNEGLIKDLTGGDTISARFLYSEPFSFKPSFKLWLYGNHKPVITNTDDGIWRRVRLIPFDVQIPEAEREPGLAAKLLKELPGILAWAVRGWQEYRRNGLVTPKAVTQATAEYRSESDILGLFLTSRCLIEGNATAEGGKLYNAYVDWAMENGLRPFSTVRFARSLRERGYSKEKNTATGRVEYQGIKLLSSSAEWSE